MKMSIPRERYNPRYERADYPPLQFLSEFLFLIFQRSLQKQCGVLQNFHVIVPIIFSNTYIYIYIFQTSLQFSLGFRREAKGKYTKTLIIV